MLRLASYVYKTYICRFMNSRARPGQAYVPTKFEHIANMVTHGLIIGPAILGMFWMLSLATNNAQYWAALVYGASTLALFITSTTFHTLSYHTGKYRNLKEFFHIGDRAIIYIFIAASYTPWLMLKDFHGWDTFTLWVVWIGAGAGILYQYTFHEQYKWLETLFYLIVGVCPSIIIMSMKEYTGLFEMALGGAVYIVGVVFFKCDGVIPFAHAIWHCFVFVGAVFHYIAVCKHLLGETNYIADEIPNL